jgi:hypothetical protein
MDPVTLPIPWFPCHSNLLSPGVPVPAWRLVINPCLGAMCHPCVSHWYPLSGDDYPLQPSYEMAFSLCCPQPEGIEWIHNRLVTREKGKPCLFHHALDPQMSSKDDIIWQDVVKSQTGILFKLKLDAARIQSQKNLCTGLRRLRLFSHSCLIGCSAARLQGWELLEMRVFQKFKTISVFYQ